MKKIVMMVILGVAFAFLTGCSESKNGETKTTTSTGIEIEETTIEETTIEETTIEESTVYVSDEYLSELGYNSKQNVYFGQ